MKKTDPVPGGGAMKSTKFWLVVIGLLLAAGIIGLFFVQSQQKAGAQVVIDWQGETVETLPLTENRTLRYERDDGQYNIVVIENGAVRVSEASCPDQVCVRHKPTDQTADPIVCLPNDLVVKVMTAGEQSQLDGVS